MGILRKTINGKQSKFWYYDFEFNGHRYSKSTRKTTAKEARTIEEEAKRNLKERYEACMRDGASDIALARAVALAIEKPTEKKRAEKQNKRKTQIWADFMGWINEFFPQVTLVSQVTRPIAESYV